jgi:hypothetical protein
MPNYETLDRVADSYIPLLAIVSLGSIVVAAVKAEWRMAGLRLLTIGALLAIAYGLMLVDRRLSIWSRFGLDYSTHTAVALVLVAFLAASKPRLSPVWWSSLIAYVLLMLYQGYHTLSDIIVTGVVVVVVGPAWLVVAVFLIVSRQLASHSADVPGQADLSLNATTTRSRRR